MKLKATKNCPKCNKDFQWRKNGPRIGKMSFTALKDAEEERVKIKYIHQLFAHKRISSYFNN